MKIGEIWIHKETERKLEIDNIEFSIISSFTWEEGDTSQKILDKIKDNETQDNIVEGHWVDTGEELTPPQPRTQFIKEFRRER